jgi:hypothetical protein
LIELDRLIEKHRRNGLLIDSNLFLLWVVGSTNESRIARFNRTQKYSVQDFRLLRVLVHEFQEIVTSPHILTEVSNLATIEEPELRTLRSNFHQIVQRTQEICEESRTGCADDAFPRFGLTDAAIRRTASRPLLVLTDDLPLYHYLSTSGLDAINFNHIRPL